MSLIDIGLSVYPFLLEWVLIIFVFKGVCPFHLYFHIRWDQIVSMSVLFGQHLWVEMVASCHCSVGFLPLRPSLHQPHPHCPDFWTADHSILGLLSSQALELALTPPFLHWLPPQLPRDSASPACWLP